MTESVKDIIRAYCIVHYPEADGLTSFECGCSFDDLQPCENPCMDCIPAKWDQELEVFTALKVSEVEV